MKPGPGVMQLILSLYRSCVVNFRNFELILNTANTETTKTLAKSYSELSAVYPLGFTI